MVGNDNIEKTIIIEIETDSKATIEELFEKEQKNKTLKTSDGQVDITLLSSGETLSFDGSLIVTIAISFGVGVASSIVGGVILELCKPCVKKLKINNQRTRITEDAINSKIQSVIGEETKD